jgi:hypothetical protein
VVCPPPGHIQHHTEKIGEIISYNANNTNKTKACVNEEKRVWWRKKRRSPTLRSCLGLTLTKGKTKQKRSASHEKNAQARGAEKTAASSPINLRGREKASDRAQISISGDRRAVFVAELRELRAAFSGFAISSHRAPFVFVRYCCSTHKRKRAGSVVLLRGGCYCAKGMQENTHFK